MNNQINRLLKDQSRVVRMSQSSIEQLKQRKKKLHSLHESFQHCRKELQWGVEIESIKESIIEIAAYISDQINKQDKRIRASEKTQKHLKRLSKQISELEQQPKKKKRKTNDKRKILITNPFMLH